MKEDPYFVDLFFRAFPATVLLVAAALKLHHVDKVRKHRLLKREVRLRRQREARARRCMLKAEAISGK